MFWISTKIIAIHLLLVSFDSDSETDKWHARFGHVDQDRMSRLAKGGLSD